MPMYTISICMIMVNSTWTRMTMTYTKVNLLLSFYFAPLGRPTCGPVPRELLQSGFLRWLLLVPRFADLTRLHRGIRCLSLARHAFRPLARLLEPRAGARRSAVR